MVRDRMAWAKSTMTKISPVTPKSENKKRIRRTKRIKKTRKRRIKNMAGILRMENEKMTMLNMVRA